MNRQTFTWGSWKTLLHQKELKIEFLYIFGLLFAALLLFCSNLGYLPLRDWDEGTVAQVAKEIAQSPPYKLTWLFPTLWGEPYLNKPPLVHNIIAFFYSVGGINEWTTRLPSAILTAFSVPLLYGIGREIFVTRTPALFSALIYLSFLPVVRHGRLAMLEGAVLCFEMLLFWSILRSRRDLRWALGVGIGFALLCLTKGMMGLLLVAIALIFIAWDTPRILTSFYLWIGLIIGTLPVAAWYTAQWVHNSRDFLDTMVISQSLERIYAPVENHQGPIWYYLLEIIKYGLPWLIFSSYGLRLAWQNRSWSWAKLVLVWAGVYFLAVSFMVTKLPWYIVPIYPALALAGGMKLYEARTKASYHAYPKVWGHFFLFLTVIIGIITLIFVFIKSDYSLLLILTSVCLTLGVTRILMWREDPQFILMLFWGMYISLLLFVSSSYWIWELNEAFPVKEVATILRHAAPIEDVVYTSFGYERPSLNFYSDRRVISSSNRELKKHWKELEHPYLLVDKLTLDELKLKSVKIVANAPPDWSLITKIEKKS